MCCVIALRGRLLKVQDPGVSHILPGRELGDPLEAMGDISHMLGLFKYLNNCRLGGGIHLIS
jgi:hypothetical protein